jgi:two-component system phosphate regulon sensor histidine kinase PhoR
MDKQNEENAQPSPSPSAEELQRRLGRAERLLACFGKAVGHELPSRLVAILGLLRVLEADAADQLAPEIREGLFRLTAVTQRARTLVADLAELSRGDRNPQPRETVNLAEISREAVAEVNQLFPGYLIEYHIAEESLPLTVPYVALHRVLVYLLRFALATAATDRPLRVEIGSERRGDTLELRVADNGCGLGPERQTSAFEPFACGAEGSGSGLGLFPVRHIVESWGGTIRLQTEQGRGSTFTIVVPQP